MALRGLDQHVRRLKRLAGPELDRKVGAALFAGGQMIQVEAQLSITRGATSGKGHVPSAPGQAPNADTHHLADNIETTLTVGSRGPVVEVASNAGYSAVHELGSSRHPRRPFMAPARDKMRPKIEDLIVKAVKSLVRGG